jgi:hypothetical protein
MASQIHNIKWWLSWGLTWGVHTPYGNSENCFLFISGPLVALHWGLGITVGLWLGQLLIPKGEDPTFLHFQIPTHSTWWNWLQKFTRQTHICWRGPYLFLFKLLPLINALDNIISDPRKNYFCPVGLFLSCERSFSTDGESSLSLPFSSQNIRSIWLHTWESS